MGRKPTVSIITITYNQEGYIRQALDGFISQKTDFDFEVIVGDDNSTDKTPSIVREYAKQYPGIIKPVLRKKNIGSMQNFVDCLKQTEGEYIAICEGDDYWTDPQKLQVQVDFLNSHPDYSLCFHRVEVRFENNELPPAVFPDSGFKKQPTVESLLRANFIQTNSVLYRRQDYSRIPEDIVPGDWYMHLYHAQFGKIGFIDKVMAVYRRHTGGIWWASHNNVDEIWKKYGVQHLRLFVEIDKLFGQIPRYKLIINDHIDRMYRAILRTDRIYHQDMLQQAVELFPGAAKTYMLDEARRQEEATKAFSKHSEEQAKIIKHYVDMSDGLRAENQYLKAKLLVRLEGAIKSRLPLRWITNKGKQG